MEFERMVTEVRRFMLQKNCTCCYLHVMVQLLWPLKKVALHSAGASPRDLQPILAS